VQSRVDALVKFAGGHDPGPLTLPDDTADAPTGTGPPPVPGHPHPRFLSAMFAPKADMGTGRSLPRSGA
jgi:hypothetical protein